MKKLMLIAASAASVLPALAQEGSPGSGVSFVQNAAGEIATYNTPIISLLTACFAIVMIFVGYKLAKRSVSKA